jgi:fatty acid desaturase
LHQAHQTIKRLAAHCNQYRKPDARRAITQIVTTVIPCVLVAVAMYWSLGISYWLTLLLAVPMAGLVIRLFIIQHDCGHGSFFASQKVNTWLGRVLSVLTLTPYADWRRDHALHHASSANLDRRGVGDIDTLTVAEYRALPRHRRLWYRVYRNPLFLVFIGAPIHFLILQRFPKNLRWAERSLWSSVLALNVAIIAVYGSLMLALGWRDTLLLVLPVFFLSSAIGVWLFFVQHGHSRLFLLRVAACPALVYRQYRPASRSPSLQPGSELPSAGMRRCLSGASGDEQADHLAEHPDRSSGPLGRGERQARRLLGRHASPSQSARRRKVPSTGLADRDPFCPDCFFAFPAQSGTLTSHCRRV